MRLVTKVLGIAVPAVLLVLVLSQTNCQPGGEHEPDMRMAAPVPAPDPAAPAPSTSQPAGTSRALIYVKVVIDKKYNMLARLVGGMRDCTWERTTYDAANPWWSNPPIAYCEPPFADADVTGRADGDVMTGQGASANVTARATVVPHADVAVRTVPRSDGMKGVITGIMSTAAEYYDGRWVEMVYEKDRRVTFRFDTCDPSRPLEVVQQEARAIPDFALERYTRDEVKWEPRSAWPAKGKTGDWRVVIYGRDVTLEVTSYRYVEPLAAGAQR